MHYFFIGVILAIYSDLKHGAELRVGAGREQVYSIYCHISLNIQQILIKFTPLVYCMNILQIVKFDLICIMVAMVTDKSLLSVNGFPIKQIPKNLLALQ